jgi:pentatricopeptide repeat protein
MQNLKQFAKNRSIKAAENVIQFGSLERINQVLNTRMNNPLLSQKVLKQRYANTFLNAKLDDQLALVSLKHCTLPYIDATRFTSKNMLLEVLKNKSVKDFVKDMDGNPYLKFEYYMSIDAIEDALAMNLDFPQSATNEFTTLPEYFNNYKISKAKADLLLMGYYSKHSLQKTRALFENLKHIEETRQMAYTLMIECLCSNNMPGEALEIYKVLRRNQVPANNRMFAALIKLSKLSKAVTWFHKNQNNRKSNAMFGAMIRKYFEYQEPILAYKMLRQGLLEARVSSHSARIHIPATLVEGILKDLENKNMDYFRDMIKFSNISGKHLSLLIAKLMFYSGNGKLTLDLYNEYFMDGGAAQGFLVPTKAHIEAMKAYFDSDRDAALKIFEKYGDQDKPRFLEVLVSLYAKLGEKSQVFKYSGILEEMGVSKNIIIFNSLLTVADDVATKNKLVEEMHNLMIIPSPEYPKVYEALKQNPVTSKFKNLQ